MAHALTLVRLDLRDLAAPEPMERILDCLRTLQRSTPAAKYRIPPGEYFFKIQELIDNTVHHHGLCR